MRDFQAATDRLTDALERFDRATPHSRAELDAAAEIRAAAVTLQELREAGIRRQGRRLS